MGRATVEERVREVDARVRPLWAARLSGDAITVISKLTIVVFKAEREVRVIAHDSNRLRDIAVYPITAASGTIGPKLREGDRQVPEGIYAISFLNPNSRYRLSMRVDYPNEADRAAARADGRDLDHLGGDIMIHGSDKSVGCIALGDPAIEELFWLAATVGVANIEVVISPSKSPIDHVTGGTPAWLRERYAALEQRLAELPIDRAH